MTEKEINLVTQAKSGSKEAFNKLYTKYASSVRFTIRQFYTQPDMIDELMSITFVKAYKKLNTFVTNDSIRAWLCTIASNSCIDYQRKKNKFKLLSLDDEGLFIPISTTVPNAEENMVRIEEVRKLHKCIKMLTSKQQKIINMFYFEGKLYREIADTLALPLGTVQSDLNRAKHKLKKLLTV